MIIYYTDKFTGRREESHRLLEKAIAAHTGSEIQAKMLTGALQRGEHGKPYIEGFSCFSISHTGNIWAVLIADRECGLDIQLGRNCSMQSIAERWFAPEDAAAIAELCGKNQYDAFFRLWTRREALTKALGGTVYDLGLPPVMPVQAEVDGSWYSITDIELPDNRQVYAALCIEGKSAGHPEEIRYLEEFQNER